MTAIYKVKVLNRDVPDMYFETKEAATAYIRFFNSAAAKKIQWETEIVYAKSKQEIFNELSDCIDMLPFLKGAEA